MLAFSRQQLLEPQLVDLSAIVRELQPMLEPMLGEDIELVTDLDPALPPVLADPGQLEQVLLNLASNARDAMPEGGRLTISTGAPELSEEFLDENLLRPSPYVLLEVADTGIGIDERTRARLFEPFFTTKGVGKGTGLGLASSYGIVEQSGGTIEVDSAPGRGATFRIYLPQAEQAVTATTGETTSRTTVLVVEDNHGLRDLASLVLEEAGFAVLSAASGPEALAVSAGHPGHIDLLLTDLVMPGMSGTKLAERLRAQRLGLNVIYMTGYGANNDKELSLPHGSDLLVKPFLPEQLLERVEAVLRSDRGAAEA
jgi:CheY-like chemotaxis protein